jgi:hypothetical protein
MLVASVFWSFMIASYVLVLLYGGRAARIFINFVLLAALLTLLAFATLPMAEYGFAVLAIDGVLLGVALYFVARAQSYWPVWFAGFHLIGVATSLARWLLPNDIPQIYENLTGFWAIPALMTMVVVVIRDRKSLGTA